MKSIKQQEAVLSQRWPRDAPYMWMPFLHNFNGFVPMDTVNDTAKFEVHTYPFLR